MRLARFTPRFALALLLATSAGGPAFADYKEALEAIRKGDQAGGFLEMTKAAESGNPEAQFLSGQMLTQGVGTVRDPGAALGWFEKASKGGHVGAMSMAGTMYAYGDGVAINYGKAFPLLKKAAEAGDMHAQNNLAVLYHFGLGTEVDEAKALGWVLRAETLGLAAASSLRKEIEANATAREKAEGERLADQPLAGTVGAVAGAARTTHVPPPLPGGHSAATVFPDPKPPLRTGDTPSRNDPKPSLSAAARQQIASEAAASRGAQPMARAAALPPAPSSPASSSPVSAADAPAAEAPAAPVREAAVAPPAPPAPSPPAATDALTAPPAVGGFAAQIAALPNGSDVEKAWRGLQAKYAAQTQGQSYQFVTVDLGPKGVFTRILVGAFSERRQALALCDQFKRAGHDCLVQKR